MLSVLCIGRIFCGEPASTSPENALGNRARRNVSLHASGRMRRDIALRLLGAIPNEARLEVACRPSLGLGKLSHSECLDGRASPIPPGIIASEAPHRLLVICGAARGDVTSSTALVHLEGTSGH
jgi:hypothetical protein